MCVSGKRSIKVFPSILLSLSISTSILDESSRYELEKEPDESISESGVMISGFQRLFSSVQYFMKEVEWNGLVWGVSNEMESLLLSVVVSLSKPVVVGPACYSQC